ncbi:MAG: hypothetical protein JNK05_34455 [Myxococcales bacterium]|nr:hypothetical protein [Myxococcales bacterium]
MDSALADTADAGGRPLCESLLLQLVDHTRAAHAGRCQRDDECDCYQQAECMFPVYVNREVFDRENPAVRALREQRIALGCALTPLDIPPPEMVCDGASVPPCEPACVEGRCVRRAACVPLHDRARSLFAQRSCHRREDCRVVRNAGASPTAVSTTAAVALEALVQQLRALGCRPRFGSEQDDEFSGYTVQCRARRCTSTQRE